MIKIIETENIEERPKKGWKIIIGNSYIKSQRKKDKKFKTLDKAILYIKKTGFYKNEENIEIISINNKIIISKI